MKGKISIAASLVLILLAIILTFQITSSFVDKEYQAKVDTLTKTQSDFSKLVEADGLIRDHFKGAVDEDTLQYGLIRGYVSALSDPYSRFMTAEEYLRYQEQKTGTGTGVGARFAYDPDKAEVIVYAVFPGSPAAQSGLRKGDVLYRIGDTPASDLSYYDAVEAFAGEPGTTVTVTVKRKVAAQTLEMDFTVTRQEVKEPTVSYELLSEEVGYVQIFDVTASTPAEFAEAVGTLVASGVHGIVFDVRNNTGSDVNAACEMLDLLLPAGTLMKTVNNKGKETEVNSGDDSVSVAMSVVMNASTACAPEMFAATLRDFGAATLVGETTYGKATLQTVVDMEDGSALLLSNESVTPPISPSFEGVGVIPDVESKLKPANLYLATHEQDNQLQDAIKALAI